MGKGGGLAPAPAQSQGWEQHLVGGSQGEGKGEVGARASVWVRAGGWPCACAEQRMGAAPSYTISQPSKSQRAPAAAPPPSAPPGGGAGRAGALQCHIASTFDVCGRGCGDVSVLVAVAVRGCKCRGYGHYLFK